MDKTEFDQFADEYHALHAKNIDITGETPEFFAEYKIRDIAKQHTKQKRPRVILDFGCGIGSSLPHIRHYFPESAVVCLDVSERSLDIARLRFPEQAEFRSFDGKHIPLADASVDIALVACVFHHIPQTEHVTIITEIRRVLRPNGRLYVFEHNPYNPLTVKAVNSCEFDKNAVLITSTQMKAAFIAGGFYTVHNRFRLFFPRPLHWLRFTERALTWCPLGAQYCVI